MTGDWEVYLAIQDNTMSYETFCFWLDQFERAAEQRGAMNQQDAQRSVIYQD